MRHIDLSHTIEDGLITYKGLPAPIICDYLSREKSRAFYTEGTEFQIGRIEMVANTGTYIDSPFHRYSNGKDLSEITFEQFVNLPAVIIKAHHTQQLAVDKHFFEGVNVQGKAVLVHTGWAEYWKRDTYFTEHPFLTEDAAIHLRDSGAVLVGIDSHNIDDTRGKSRPVHSTLLKNNILIAEHLCNLETIPEGDFTFTAVPPKIKGMGTFPVRAFATV